VNFFDKTLEDYRTYLGNFTDSKNTLKNYVSDVRIFLTFLNSRYPPLDASTISSLLTTQTISEFESYLSIVNPPATLSRRVSSIRKFVDYFLETNPLPAVPASTVVSPPTPQQETPVIPPAPEIVSPSSNGSLLRLLPEEVTPEDSPITPPPAPVEKKVRHRLAFPKWIFSILPPAISFTLGFFLTLFLYPLFSR
jgi:hypothetical protein